MNEGIYMMLTLMKRQVAILISDRAGFKVRKVIRPYIMIMGSILQKTVTILNVYVPNKRASQYMRQKLIEHQGETDKSTIS